MITSLFQYTLGVSIPLIVMWTAYRLALANRMQLSLNRLVFTVDGIPVSHEEINNIKTNAIKTITIDKSGNGKATIHVEPK